MLKQSNLMRTTLILVIAWGFLSPSSWAQYRGREVVDGIKSNRIIPGKPYDLAGKRIVFTNWYYVQPGDLNWIDDEGKSVYVDGDEHPNDSHFVGIESPRGIRLRARQPQVKGPLDMPYRMLIQDGDLFKGWTSSEYFESSDGMTWEKKANLQFDEGYDDGVYQIFIDPSAPPAERYKALHTGTKINEEEFKAYIEKNPDRWEPRALLHYKEKKYASCIRGAVSPDGIRWTTLPDPLVVEYADTWNTCYYDRVLEKYVLYTRQWSAGPRTHRLPSDIRRSWTGVGRRAIGRSESDDFSSFPPSQLIIEPSPDMLPSEVLYTNSYTTIPGAPDQHLMFPTVWNASINDTTRVVLYSSHDGSNWHFVPGGDLLQTQPFGQWNGGAVWVHPNLIELPDGTWAISCRGDNVPHKYPRGQRKAELGFATWPKGRLVALEAPDQGKFTMIPVMAPGRTLKINANTKRTGGIWIEVVGVEGRSFEDCTRIFGDRHWTTIQWGDQTDLGFEEGKPITLRFKLDQAEIFGLEFE